MKIKSKATYQVTIRRELHFQYGDCWVARDSNGIWRSYCKFDQAANAADAARAMFHACEIVDVTARPSGDATVATIEGS